MKSNENNPSAISSRQLARLLMITPRRVQQLAAAGVFPRAAPDAYPLVGAVQGYVRHLTDEARRPASVASAVRVANARAEEIERRIAARRSELIPAAEAVAVIDAAVRIVAAELTALPARLPSELRPAIEREAGEAMARIERAAAIREGM